MNWQGSKLILLGPELETSGLLRPQSMTAWLRLKFARTVGPEQHNFARRS